MFIAKFYNAIVAFLIVLFYRALEKLIEKMILIPFEFEQKIYDKQTTAHESRRRLSIQITILWYHLKHMTQDIHRTYSSQIIKRFRKKNERKEKEELLFAKIKQWASRRVEKFNISRLLLHFFFSYIYQKENIK